MLSLKKTQIEVQAKKEGVSIQASFKSQNLALEDFLRRAKNNFGKFCFKKTLRFGKVELPYHNQLANLALRVLNCNFLDAK
jgi:hypothetical protein